MKRLIDYYLNAWKSDLNRKPLLLRGARQVGKTHAARELGKLFENFVEINLELNPEIHNVFEKDLQPTRIAQELSLITNKPIIPGKTLLFFDEIQAAPKVLSALRYFYEFLPELHVIAAGSLIDFTIENIGIPVGRVQSLYMHPMSFIEFLAALHENLLIEEIFNHKIENVISELIHKKLLTYIAQYLAIGGMPEAIKCWKEIKDAQQCSKIHSTLLDAYRQDFGKYTKAFQIKYLELIFDTIPLQLGQKFKYSDVEGEYRKRELSPALDLLVTAGVARKIFHSAGQGIPIGAQADPQKYKVIFLDIALSETLLGLNISDWFLNPITELFINKGSIIEAFVGQEILAYSDPTQKAKLYYWQRDVRGSQAEIDYLVQKENNIIPIEVKGGKGTTLKSLQLFFETHLNSPYGIRFSTLNYSIFEKIHSYPLYSISAALGLNEKALKYLTISS